MKLTPKIALTVAALSVGALALSGCGYNEEYTERKENQSKALEDSLGIQNQKERLKREEDPNQIRYVYVFAPLDGRVMGYYTILGKVSTSATQNAPENDIIQPWAGGERYVVDSAKDDGTYGDSETGSFFFTTENVLIEIDGLPYLQSDAPITIYGDAPKFNK